MRASWLVIELREQKVRAQWCYHAALPLLIRRFYYYYYSVLGCKSRNTATVDNNNASHDVLIPS